MKPMHHRVMYRAIDRGEFRAVYRLLPVVLIVLAAALAGVGCSDSTGPEFTTLGIAIQSGPFGANGVVVGDPEDQVWQINITSAQVVLGRIEIRGADDTVVFLSEEHAPLVYDLNLNGMARHLDILPVAPGEFSSSLLRIEKLESTDSTAWNANPDLRNSSIRVEGYINGDPEQTFVFTTELDTEESREFEPVVLVAEGSATIVFHVDYTQWFSNGTGGLVNPDDGQLAAWRSTVEENIVNSFDVY